MNYFLGIDSGSVSLKSVIINEKAEIIRSSYIKNYNLMVTLKETLKQIKFDGEISGVGITGTGQEFISKIIGGDILEPETVAHYEATIRKYPKVRTILDIGGQDSKLMLIDEKGLLRNIAFNKSCGAGTGGVIELIADELDVELDDVGDLALQYKNDFPFAGKCLTAENFLLTNNGTKFIKDIKKGDLVLTNKGFNKVTNVFKRNYDGFIYKIYRRFSSIPLIVTEGHPILLTNQWSNSEDLKESDYITCPFIFDFQPKWFKWNKDFFRLIGYYLAEGWVNTLGRYTTVKGKKYYRIDNAIEFGFHKDEKEYINDVKNLMYRFFDLKCKFENHNGNGIRLRYTSKKVANFLRKTFDSGATNKKIPFEWLGISKESKIELIKGFFRGDGSFSKRNNKYRIKIDTVSLHLFETLALFLKDIGYVPHKTISSSKLNEILCVVNNRAIKRKHILYSLCLYGNQAITFMKQIENKDISYKKHKKHLFYIKELDYIYYPTKKLIGGHINYPIKKIIKERYNGKVYNLEVDESHNYIVNDFVCHNCGVFARTSVIDRKNKGVAKEDILMGVCKALVNNYFAILGKGKNLIPPFVFQGATAKNKALVKCMKDELKHKVNVPENPELMGAYGIALITMKDFKGKTNFKGIGLADSDLKTKTFICGGCVNNCEVTQLFENNSFIGGIGSRCGKWNNKEKM